MENWLLMQTFYHGLTNSTHETMDAAAGGAFLSLTLLATTTLVEKMDSNKGLNEERVDPQEGWRYASTQGGRYAICQDGHADEEAQRLS